MTAMLALGDGPKWAAKERVSVPQPPKTLELSPQLSVALDD